MHSPLISKIRCNHPNKKGSRNANRNHLIYIATREGVDLSPLSDGTPARSGLFGNFDISDVQSAGNSLYQLSAEGTHFSGHRFLKQRRCRRTWLYYKSCMGIVHERRYAGHRA